MLRLVVACASVCTIALVTSPPTLLAQTVSETTIYPFSGGDGNSPNGVIQASDGNFYGTALTGGSSLGTGACTTGGVAYSTPLVDTGCGTLFQLTSSGQVAVLHSFLGAADGSNPGPLVEGPDGNFYGTAVFGGGNNAGTIFQITPSGAVTVLYSFTGGQDGAYPNLLILGNDGNFYGTTAEGGAIGAGTIFTITPSGTISTLYSFSGGSDGAFPNALVQGSDGEFYGTTQAAGNLSYCVPDFGPSGCGTVFAFSVSGGLSTIYTFPEDSDGAESRSKTAVVSSKRLPNVVIPQPGHLVRMGSSRHVQVVPNALAEYSDGSFYGTTSAEQYSATVFNVTKSGSLTTLYTFGESGDGGGSLVSLDLASDGNFYGTSGNDIFQITPAGVVSVEYTFPEVSTGEGDIPGSNGGSPWLLTQGSTGDLYGAAVDGGNTSDCSGVGCGALFYLAMSPVLAAPVQLSFSTSSVSPGTAVQLSWSVLNAFSATLQQCYAFIQGTPTGAGTWTGLQTGTLSNDVYSGSASITPIQAGTYTYALTCGGQESGFAQLTALPPAVTTSSLPGGYTVVAYSTTLVADDGLAPYTWSVTPGSLPAGLTLNATTGVISGTPTQAGTSNFTVTVQDSESQPLTATADLSIKVVAAAISANPSNLSVTAPGSSASTTLTISGFATSSIILSCSGLPSEAGCTFGTPTTSNGSETVSLQINTTAASSARLFAPLDRRSRNMLYALALPGAAGLVCLWSKRRRRQCPGVFLALLLIATISMTACGGNGGNPVSTNPGTPVGSSTVVVTAMGGAQSATFNLTVSVQ